MERLFVQDASMVGPLVGILLRAISRLSSCAVFALQAPLAQALVSSLVDDEQQQQGQQNGLQPAWNHHIEQHPCIEVDDFSWPSVRDVAAFFMNC